MSRQSAQPPETGEDMNPLEQIKELANSLNNASLRNTTDYEQGSQDTGYRIADEILAILNNPGMVSDECPACHKNWGEHRPGYSASKCQMKSLPAVDGGDKQANAEPEEGHSVQVMSHDGMWRGEARWEHQESAYVTQDAVIESAQPAGVSDAYASAVLHNFTVNPAATSIHYKIRVASMRAAIEVANKARGL